MIYSYALWVLDSRFELRSRTALIGLLVASADGLKDFLAKPLRPTKILRAYITCL
jgi:hypothetical protein